MEEKQKCICYAKTRKRESRNEKKNIDEDAKYTVIFYQLLRVHF